MAFAEVLMESDKEWRMKTKSLCCLFCVFLLCYIIKSLIKMIANQHFSKVTESYILADS